MPTKDSHGLLPEPMWGLDPMFWVYSRWCIGDFLHMSRHPKYHDVLLYQKRPFMKVSVIGMVTEVDKAPMFTRYSLDDTTGRVACIVWNNTDAPDLQMWDLAIVRGDVTHYRGARQIVVREVEVVEDRNIETLWHLEALEIKK